MDKRIGGHYAWMVMGGGRVMKAGGICNIVSVHISCHIGKDRSQVWQMQVLLVQGHKLMCELHLSPIWGQDTFSVKGRIGNISYASGPSGL